jgi:ribonuclease-3
MNEADLLKTEAERLDAFQDVIGYRFAKPALLLEALIHRSHVNEMLDFELPDNERLEFLGDAVLEFVVTEYLYSKYPGETEGRLTVMRSAIVERRRCAQLVVALGMDQYILLGRGERLGGELMRKSILANAYEALIGAIYLDGGIKKARTFALGVVEKHCPGIELESTGNFKAELQIYSQRNFQRIPRYTLLRSSGPDHRKVFDVAVSIDGVAYGSGSGPSKKAAQQEAACAALARLAQLEAEGGVEGPREARRAPSHEVIAAAVAGPTPADVGGTMAAMCVEAPPSSTVPAEWRMLERIRRGVYRHVGAGAR